MKIIIVLLITTLIVGSLTIAGVVAQEPQPGELIPNFPDAQFDQIHEVPPPPSGEDIHPYPLNNRGTNALTSPYAALGQPGTNFRYIKTYGVIQQPYISDYTHINRPFGLYMGSGDNLFVVEEQGCRILKYSPAGNNMLAIGKAGYCHTGDYSFNYTRDVTVDSLGNIWEVDGSRVVKYNASGTFLESLPAENSWESGDDNTHFNTTWGIVIDSPEHLFISDQDNQRVQVYDISSGSPVYSTTIGTKGIPGSGSNQFNQPRRLAVDSSNRLYVVDHGNNRVQRCTYSSGWTCATFDSGLSNALGITIDASNNVFISDTNNNRVRKCISAGSCADFITNSYWLYDLAIDSSGNIYGTAAYEDIILKYNSIGQYQSTFVGIEFVPYLTDDYHYYQPRVAIDNEDNLIIAEETGQRVVKLDKNGSFLWSHGVPGVDIEDNLHFVYPHGVATDKVGKIYVANNHNVQILSKDGAIQATLGTGEGVGNYQFKWIAGVAVGSDGKIYVSDAENHRVQIYDTNRIYLHTLGYTGVSGSDNYHFDYPIGVEVDTDGNIYVADINNCRVQKYNSSLVYQMTFGRPGGCTQDLLDVSPDDVTVDTKGRVYIAGWDNRVQVFDKDGNYLTSIGGAWGDANSQFEGACGVAIDSQGNVYISDYDNARIQVFAPGVPGWQQVNINGFGDIDNGTVRALAVYQGYLFAGTQNLITGLQIWRMDSLRQWIPLVMDGFGDADNQYIYHMIEFNNSLYAGIWNQTSFGGIWRTTNGENWERVIDGGFGVSENNATFRLIEFNGYLYAGTISFIDNVGAEIWRSSTGDSGSWIKVVDSGLNDKNNVTILTFEEFNNYLYAGTWNDTGGEIWRTQNGTIWTQVNENGFGYVNNKSAMSLAVLGEYLYAGSSNWTNGGEIWRCQVCNGTDWVRIVDKGYEDINNGSIDGLLTKDSALYAFVANETTGAQIWKMENDIWQRISTDGWGDNNNIAPFADNSAVTFNDTIFVGTQNSANGGEIWQMLDQIFLPIITR